MIGANYKSKAVQAVLGDGHSAVIPENLWGGWLDNLDALIAMTGLTVPHAAFTETTDGVINSAVIDAGVAGVGWNPYSFALYDAASGGDIVLVAAVTPFTPTDGDALVFPIGSLTFTIAP